MVFGCSIVDSVIVSLHLGIKMMNAENVIEELVQIKAEVFDMIADLEHIEIDVKMLENLYDRLENLIDEVAESIS